ncbi:unnamed protein product [Closterium sp. NIES-53]
MAHPGQCKDEASGLEKVVLRQAGGATAEVFFHGGHVTSWKHDGKEENLFMSSKAIFKPPKAIRGGIPVCFPQLSSSAAQQLSSSAARQLSSSPAHLSAASSCRLMCFSIYC